MESRGESRRIEGQTVSSNLFDVLGAAPMIGRTFGWNDEKPGNRAVILSYSLWQSEFGSAKSVIGSFVRLDGQNYRVAGVMPKDFRFPLGSSAPALWKSLAEEAEGKSPKTEMRGFNVLGAIGRLKPGVSQDQAQADLSLVAANLAREYPDTNKQYYSALVKPELQYLTGDIRPAMRLLFAAVSLVLLLVCTNVAGLLLARGSSRSGEFAVRVAIGAGRAVIIRQVLVESIALFVCGGAAGLMLAFGLVRASLKLVPIDIPRIESATVDARALAFVLVMSLLTGVVFGAFPAWRVSRAAPQLGLREGSRSLAGGAGQHRLHSALVIVQTAIAMVLLIGSGLLMRSFVHILRVDPGFDPKQLMTSRLGVSFDSLKHDQHYRVYERAVARISAVPGVGSVSAGWPLPMSNNSAGISFNIAGRPVAKGDEPAADLGVAMPGYFETMRIPLITGRSFGQQDGLAGPPTIIVNQAFARKYFPGQDPIGQRVQVRLGDDVFNDPVREVVGVIGDYRSKGLTAEAAPQFYLPYTQAVVTNPFLVIRTAMDTEAAQRQIVAAVHELDSHVPVYQVSTMEEYLSRSAAQPRFQAFVLTCFAGIGLILAVIGLYGLLSYTVTQRTFELGLRMALGAQRTDVLGLIIRGALTLAAVGTAAGLVVSAVITRFISGMLFRVEPTDPVTFAGTAVLILLVSVAAGWAPAYRAANLDPTRTLRGE
jgi:predicted permease